MNPRPRLVGLICALATAAPSSNAHEFWIQPDDFTPSEGQLVHLHLRVGDEFPGSPVVRDDTHIIKFECRCPDETTTPILGQHSHDPAGLFRPAKPGCHILYYRNAPIAHTMDATKFEAYLKEDGLEKIIQSRASTGQSSAQGREIYSRCAKSIVQSSASASAGFDTPVGLRLELIPEIDPATLDTTDDLRRQLPVALRYEGKPLEGALVRVQHPDHPESTQLIRTDAQGRIQAKISMPGMWLISAVEMIPAPAESGADWESLWASLTFEAPGVPG